MLVSATFHSPTCAGSVNWLVPMLGLLLLSGCASQPQAPAVVVAQPPTQAEVTQPPVPEPRLGVSVAQPQLLIANDLIEVLRQVDGYRPRQAPINLPAPTNAFSSAFEDALVANGYQLRRVAQRSGNGILMTSVVQDQSAPTADQYTYFVVIDRLALKRSYRVNGNYVEPMTSLFVKGVPSESLQLNDRKFLSGS